ncbi:MAG: hypothetical protein A2X48_12975 [Lentisphaerae bacterium GWF2_49_21]|nr:MAG: hypothetical protein A2X48_12975 [Lentisphaerae bacterium GWF2_49_21]
MESLLKIIKLYEPEQLPSSKELESFGEYAGVPDTAITEILVFLSKVEEKIQKSLLDLRQEFLLKREIEFPELKKIDLLLFKALLVLSCVNELKTRHREIGIPEDITRETASDIGIWIQDCHDKNGIWGLDNLEWLKNHFSCSLFRIGRLQFILQRKNIFVHAFFNSATAKITALTKPGIKLRNDGFVNLVNPDWESSYKDLQDRYIGNPVNPSGFVVKKTVVLLKGEWRKVLDSSDLLLDIHIPAGDSFAEDKVSNSLNSARNIYSKFCPDEKISGFVCNSWMLDYQLTKILKTDSNLVSFLKRFYLYPVVTDGSQTLERVFGSKDVDLTAFEPKTSLQKKCLEHLQEGKSFRNSGGFIFFDKNIDQPENYAI